MPYVKTPTGELHYYDDDAALQKYAPTGSTPISDADAATLQAEKLAVRVRISAQ